jgi:hypothetical protein
MGLCRGIRISKSDFIHPFPSHSILTQSNPFHFFCFVSNADMITRLSKSMNRFFSSLPVEKVVKRSNWSISTTGDLFCLAGSHMSTTDHLDQKTNLLEEEEDIDMDKTVLRCERQTLHRLPETGALVFAFVSPESSSSNQRLHGWKCENANKVYVHRKHISIPSGK